MDAQDVVTTHNEMLFGLEKEGNLAPASVWLNLEDIPLSEMSQSQRDEH